MKRFEFKLKRLARVRRIEEELARVEWQAAEARAREAEERVLAAGRDVAEAVESQREAQGRTSLSPLDVLNIEGAIERLTQRVTIARTEAQRCRSTAEERRAPWQALRTELEGLSRLEEKARTRHRHEREREEATQMDQLASERSARPNMTPLRGPAPRPTPDLWRQGAKA